MKRVLTPQEALEAAARKHLAAIKADDEAHLAAKKAERAERRARMSVLRASEAAVVRAEGEPYYLHSQRVQQARSAAYDAAKDR